MSSQDIESGLESLAVDLALGFTLLFAVVVLARTRAAVMERRVRALETARARKLDAAP